MIIFAAKSKKKSLQFEVKIFDSFGH